jgi:hypothetical protein
LAVFSTDCHVYRPEVRFDRLNGLSLRDPYQFAKYPSQYGFVAFTGVVSYRRNQHIYHFVGSFHGRLSWEAETAGWAMAAFQCNWYAKQALVLKRQSNSFIDHLYIASDDLAQETPLPCGGIVAWKIEKTATMSKIPGKVFMVGSWNRYPENEKGHVFTWPFKFWLPDLDSNQGPAD